MYRCWMRTTTGICSRSPIAAFDPPCYSEFDPAERPKLLLVTSAIPNEGKSTVAANLARAIAFSGWRVLPVHGDLRLGVQHELFGVGSEPGLAELLTEGGSFSSFVRDTGIFPQTGEQESSATGALHLLPRGRLRSNPGDLWLGTRCARFLDEIRHDYDCVIMDSIPVFAADDTTSLAPKMDGVVFVVRRAFAGTRVVRRALERLYERRALVLGLVFNRANTTSRSYDYCKYAEHYRGTRVAGRANNGHGELL